MRKSVVRCASSVLVFFFSTVGIFIGSTMVGTIAPAGAKPAVTQVTVGGNPQGVAVDPVTNLIYVANSTTTLSVIDGTTDTVSATITLPQAISYVAVDAVTNKIYATGGIDQEPLFVIDGATDTVTTLGGLGLSLGMAMDPTSNTLYVLVLNETVDPQQLLLLVLDGATNGGVYQRFDPNFQTNTGAIAVNSVTDKVYVGSNSDPGAFQVFDGATQSMSGPFTAGNAFQSMVTDNATNLIYSAQGNGTVSVIDGATNSQVDEISVGGLNSAIAFDPTTNHFFVTDYNTASVWTIDAATNAVVGSAIPTGSHPDGVAVNPVTGKVYVANLSDGTVSVINEAQRPSPPLDLQTSVGSGNAVISWSAPASDGGAVVTSYTATASPGGATCTATSTSCTITGLTNGTTYSVTVTASNSAGTSDPSTAVSVTPAVGATASRTTLAATGINVTLPFAFAAALLGLGGLGVLGSQRRRRKISSTLMDMTVSSLSVNHNCEVTSLG